MRWMRGKKRTRTFQSRVPALVGGPVNFTDMSGNPPLEDSITKCHCGHEPQQTPCFWPLLPFLVYLFLATSFRTRVPVARAPVHPGLNEARKLKAMRKIVVTFSLVSLLMVSCMSTAYKDAGIRITSNPRVVAGMQFVSGWTRSYSDMYMAGEIEAIMLAEKGAHDVTVLVEPAHSDDRMWLSRHWHTKTWQISVYQ